LHDVLEDCDVTFEDIEKQFDYWTARQVKMLTKRDGENYLESLMRIISIITIIVKIADNTHNMSDLEEGSLKDKYRLSKYILEQKL
jgi:(p)ppGpp synthase/HD superfamily hydrolase